MIEKSKGIVLNKIQHTDNKNIVKIYSESGTNAYVMFKGSKSKQNNTLQPMTLINFCAEKKTSTQMAWLKEVEYDASLAGGYYQLPKAVVCMFLNDVLYKLLQNAGEDKELFDFLYETLQRFYNQPFVPDFHLRFLIHCSRELGNCPMDNFQKNYVFNVQSACFEYAAKPTIVQQEMAVCLHNLLHQDMFPSDKADILPPHLRNVLLNCLLDFYNLHIIDLSKIQSLEVLKTLLHD